MASKNDSCLPPNSGQPCLLFLYTGYSPGPQCFSLEKSEHPFSQSLCVFVQTNVLNKTLTWTLNLNPPAQLWVHMCGIHYVLLGALLVPGGNFRSGEYLLHLQRDQATVRTMSLAQIRAKIQDGSRQGRSFQGSWCCMMGS